MRMLDLFSLFNPTSDSAIQFTEPVLTTFWSSSTQSENPSVLLPQAHKLRVQLTQIEVLGSNHMSIVDVFGILCAAAPQMAVGFQTVEPINLI